MSASIKKIQSGLNEIIGEKVKSDFIKGYAHIFIFAKPVHSLLYIIPYNNLLYTLLSWTDGLFYIASLIGLLICFAKNDTKKIGIYFILNASSIIVNLLRGYSLNINSIVYLAFYVFWAVIALRYNNASPTNTTLITTPVAQPQVNTENADGAEEVICSKCGNQLKPGASFCGSCGTKVE